MQLYSTNDVIIYHSLQNTCMGGKSRAGIRILIDNRLLCMETQGDARILTAVISGSGAVLFITFLLKNKSRFAISQPPDRSQEFPFGWFGIEENARPGFR